MNLKKYIPPELILEYKKSRKIPFTPGYDKRFDMGYEKSKRLVKEYQKVVKNRYDITASCPIHKGLAIESYERDQEIQKILNKGDYGFHTPNIILNPYNRSPLCAYVLFKTEKECRVYFRVKGKTKEADISDETSEYVKKHRVPIYGLYPGTKNEVYMELVGKDGSVLDRETVYIETKPLPDYMEDMVRVEKQGKESSIGLIFVGGKSTNYPMAFDRFGDIRYYMRFRPRGYGFFELANKRFIVMERQTLVPTQLIPHSTQMYEIDYFGRVYKTYYVPNGIHHDVCEMTPGGNLLVASNSQCGHDEDCIIEVNRLTGKIEKHLDLREVLYTAYRDRTNWIHVNSIDYIAKTGTVIFSARNLHTIFSLNWTNNKLNWLLGDKKFWGKTPFAFKLLKTPEDMPWHFQQHSVSVIPNDLDGDEDTYQIMLFDNHWNLRRKAPSYDDDPASYVTIYTINEKKKTASLFRRFAGIKSKITSNGLYKHDKKRIFYMGGYLAYPEEREGRCGIITEMDFKTGEVINEYDLKYYFFRALEMRFDMDDISHNMVTQGNVRVGYLQPFVRMKEKMEVPKTPVSEAPLNEPGERVRVEIEDDNLWVKSKNHLIDQVFLLGKKYNYVKDFRYPAKESDLADDMEYYLSIPLYSVAEDKYKVCVQFKGEMYNTMEEISMSKKLL